MTRVLLPLLASAAVLFGLVAAEDPPSEEEAAAQDRRATLASIEAERTELLRQIGVRERELGQLESQIDRMEELGDERFAPKVESALARLEARRKRDREAAEQERERLEASADELTARAEGWVRTAYGLSLEALPPGYLARLLWKADAGALAEPTALARDLRATLHIGEAASRTAASRIKGFLRKPYTRRTFVSLAASLATVALIETSEPFLGPVLDRWWKLLAAAAAGLVTLGTIVLLQERGVLD